MIVVLATAQTVQAGKLSWLDDVVKDVIREAEASSKVVVKGADEAAQASRTGGRLFVREAADEGLEIVARRADEVGRMGRTVGAAPAEALLESRFSRLMKVEPEMAKTFAALAPAEKRLVVEMGETAQRLARRYPGQAETMVRQLGTDGLAAVRVYGDDVAEVIAREGSETLKILRKTGRTGWSFFTNTVLPNKKKLAAAGILAVFLADPDRFVDSAGQATKYAAELFAKAGISLAGAMSDGAVKGLTNTFAELLASYGISPTMARYIGVGIAVFVVALSLIILIGAPLRWMLAPFMVPFRILRGLKRTVTPKS
jgi:hypothetical protein